jgi:hypothetical protein
MHLLLGLGCLARLSQVVDRDIRSVFRKADGDCLADSGGAAGDKHVLALKSSHPLLPFSS